MSKISSRILWMVLTLGSVSSGMRMQSSRACFSTPNCNRHNLNSCDMTQKIAITSAYYTDNSECAQQCPQNISSIQENEMITPLQGKQLQRVDNRCTYQSKCSIEAQQSGDLQKFSVLKYLCIDGHDNLDMCSGQSKSGCDVAIMFHQMENCTCYITDIRSESLDFYLLSMNSSSSLCDKLGIHINGKMIQYNCTSTVTPYQRLVGSRLQGNGRTWITVKNTRESKIWIQVQGSQSFRVTCRQNGINPPVESPMPERFTVTCSHDGTTPTVQRPTPVDGNGTKATDHRSSTADIDSNTGAIVGGVVAAILVTVVVVLLLLWFKCKRNTGRESKQSVDQTKDHRNSLASPISDNNYHEIEAPGTKQMGNNYDYAIVDDEPRHSEKQQSPQYEADYDHIGDNPSTNTEDYTTPRAILPHIGKYLTGNEHEYNYNHLATRKSNAEVINSLDYDTAASASETVQQMRTAGVSDIDNDYSYNHVDNGPQRHLKAEYDTAASATKAVAQMLKEKDYDHLQLTKSSVQASGAPYDITENLSGHTEDYSVAGAAQKHDPYDLAK